MKENDRMSWNLQEHRCVWTHNMFRYADWTGIELEVPILTLQCDVLRIQHTYNIHKPAENLKNFYQFSGPPNLRMTIWRVILLHMILTWVSPDFIRFCIVQNMGLSTFFRTKISSLGRKHEELVERRYQKRIFLHYPCSCHSPNNFDIVVQITVVVM